MMDKKGQPRPGFDIMAPAAPAGGGGGPPKGPMDVLRGGAVGSRVFFQNRGIVVLEGLDDGADVRLRFRAHEIALLEDRLGVGIMSMLNEKQLGVKFLMNAMIVGAAHMFAGKKKQKKALTESLVSRWIDRCEDNGIAFEELLEAVVKAVVGGLPGGAKYLEAMNQEPDDDEDDTGRPPSAPAA